MSDSGATSHAWCARGSPFYTSRYGWGRGGKVGGEQSTLHTCCSVSLIKSLGGHTPTTYDPQGSFCMGMGGLTPTAY